MVTDCNSSFLSATVSTEERSKAAAEGRAEQSRANVA